MSQQSPGSFRLRCLSMILMTAGGAATSVADVLKVDGTDPLADFVTIQAAVDAASDGDVIEVAPGYYFSTDPDHVPVVAINGKNLTLRALSADPADTVIAGQGIRRCLSWTNSAGACSIDGFTFDAGYTPDDGGGAAISNAAVRFTDCIFNNCVADGNGGSIHAFIAVEIPPIARSCRFIQSVADNGGAIHARGGFDLFDCEFQDVHAISNGGAVYFEGEPPGQFDHSIVSTTRFLQGEAEVGGGIYAFDANLLMHSCDFERCRAGDDFDIRGFGGGLAVDFGAADVFFCDFDRCSAGSSSGGIDVWDGDLFAEGCTFDQCSAIRYAGGIGAYGDRTRVTLSACDFTGNTVWEGDAGAIGAAQAGQPVLDASELILDRCNFHDNLARGHAACIQARNVVTATDCVFGRQQAIPGGGTHLDLIGIGTGSRIQGCEFRGGRSVDFASSVRARAIGGLEFSDCLFEDNRTESIGLGPDAHGAIHIDADENSDALIRFEGCDLRDNGGCCLFDGFFSASGGAIRVEGREAEIAFCTFASNTATDGGSLHGLFHIQNSVIGGRTSIGYGGAAYLLEGSTVVDCKISGTADCNYPWIYAPGRIAIERCTMTGGRPEGFWCGPDPAEMAGCGLGDGTTVQDSRFCSYAPAAIFGNWADVGGNGFHPDACDPADVNGDGIVDGADLAAILTSWGQPCLGCAADVDGDGSVSGADLAAILAGW